MHKFELPYNFKPDWFKRLALCLKTKPQYKEYIKFVYLPAFKEEYVKNTREYIITPPTDWKDYLNNHLKKIQSYGLDVCILLQQGATLDIVKKYFDLGIKYFTLNDDNLARQLKEIYGNNIYLTLSITRVITFEEIMNNDFSMYDCIVLYFWFNRNLDKIKELPKKYNYCILVNSTCWYNCPWAKQHWFSNVADNFNEADHCGKIIRNEDDSFNIKQTCYIKPEDLEFFEPYISTYKIVDRVNASIIIFNSFIDYVERHSLVSYNGLLDWEIRSEKNYYKIN